MIENPKKVGFSKDKDEVLQSLLSFKVSFDKKIESINKEPLMHEQNNENFINIYKTNIPNYENSTQTQQNINSDNSKKSILSNIKSSDFFANSEILLSNIDDIINKGPNLESPALIKVPTSDSLNENEDSDQESQIINHEKANKNNFSPNNTGASFYRNERLNSIDEKDESKEEDTMSKHSKEFGKEDYHIIDKEEFEKQKQSFNKTNQNEPKEQERSLPKFVFLDYKDFKNKSAHSTTSKSLEKKTDEASTRKIDYCYSMSSIPNYSSLMKKKPNLKEKRTLALENLESSNNTSLDKTKKSQRNTPSSNSSVKKINIPGSAKKDQMKYSSLHSPRSESGGSPAFLIDLKTYSALKVVNDKKNCNSLNNSKKIENSSYFLEKNKISRSEKKNLTNNNFSQLKEKTQKDIEIIDKEISDELLVINNKIQEKKQNSKKKNIKSSSCNEQDISDLRNPQQIKNGKELKKIDKSQKILKSISKCAMSQSSNEKKNLANNYMEKSVSSRKNSRNYCEVLSTPKRPNSHSKSNERAKIFAQSEKKPKTSKNTFNKIKEVSNNYLKVAFQSANIVENLTQSKKDSLMKPSSFAIKKIDEKETLSLTMKLKNKEQLVKKPNNKNLHQQILTPTKTNGNLKNTNGIKSNFSNKNSDISNSEKQLWEEIKKIYKLFNEADLICQKSSKNETEKNYQKRFKY